VTSAPPWLLGCHRPMAAPVGSARMAMRPNAITSMGGISTWPPAAAVLDAHLAGRDWIAQGRLTIADFAVAAPLMHSERAQLPLVDYGNLQAWFARVCATDAWRATETA